MKKHSLNADWNLTPHVLLLNKLTLNYLNLWLYVLSGVMSPVFLIFGLAFLRYDFIGLLVLLICINSLVRLYHWLSHFALDLLYHVKFVLIV